MRGARRLLLLAIALIVGAVGVAYHLQKARQARQAPPPPIELPPNIDATSTDWVHTQDVGGHTKVEIRARTMRQVKEPSEFELEGVELRIYDLKKKQYDRIRSPHARFDTREGTLSSASEVEITLAVSEEGPPRKDLLTIRTSGVRFDTVTAKATTDRPTSFTYGRAEGRSIGATYDPGWKDLRMHSDVVLRWHGEGPRDEMMQVEAGQLVYKEDQSKIYLSPWSRFSRGRLTLNAGESVVALEEGAIRTVDAQRARGEDRFPSRTIKYAADHLLLHFTPAAVVEKIVGEGSAKLVSLTATSETSIAADRIFFEFKASGEDSLLDNALAMGDGVLELRPRPRTGATLPETRILRSNVIKTIMQPGGELIEVVESHAPGTIEFLPNSPEQKRRRLDGERLWIWFGAENRIKRFRAAEARTRTENGRKGDQVLPPTLTSSEGLLAEFEADTGKMLRMDQWGDFHYEEGDRKAGAERAILDSENNRITLLKKARVWDAAGSTSADEIILDQKAEVHTATGNVNSTRIPEPAKSSDGLLSQNEAIHAAARKMVATSDGAYIVYEGSAVVWQGPDRIQGDRIEIDRTKGTLKAAESVASRFLDRTGEEAAGKGAEVFTTVRAEELTYMEEHKMADYKGDVHLSRPGLEINAKELRAYFRDQETKAGTGDGGTSVHHAIAEGDVSIVHQTEGRTRTGLAQLGEYYVADERVILKGGSPKVIDSVKGTTQGKELTYFARDDRLLVEGAEGQPAVSRIRR